MSHILIPSRRIWTRQPQQPVGIDWSNPITRGLTGGFLNPSVTLGRSLIPPSLPVAVGAVGKALVSASSSSVTTLPGVVSPQTAGMTVVIVARRDGTQPDGGGFGVSFLMPKVSGTADSFVHFIKTAGERIRINTTTSDASANYWETATDWPVGVFQVGAYVFISGFAPAIYRNGVKQTLSYTGGTLSGSIKPSSNAQINLATLRLNGAIGGALVFNRALSESEIRSISQNPLQIFRRRRRNVIFVDFGASAGSTLNAAAAGTAQAAGLAQLAAQVGLAGIGVAVAGGQATPAVAIPLAAASLAIAGGQAAAKATVTLSAAGLAAAAGQAGLSASVLAQAAASAQAAGNAALAAKLNALASGAAQAAGSASLTGGAPGSLAAAGQAAAQGSAVLTVTVRLQAAGAAQSGGVAAGSAQAPGALSAAGQAAASGFAQWSALINLTAAGFVQAMGQGSLAITVPLSAQGAATAQGLAQASLGGTLQPRRLVAEAPRRIRRLATGAQRLITLQHGARHV